MYFLNFGRRGDSKFSGPVPGDREVGGCSEEYRGAGVLDSSRDDRALVLGGVVHPLSFYVVEGEGGFSDAGRSNWQMGGRRFRSPSYSALLAAAASRSIEFQR